MRFGVKKKDAPAASSGGSGGSFIKYFRKGETTVRFLEPATDEWTKYFEHYSASKQRTYPCTGERDTCPGCTSDDKREQQASCRFLVNLLDTETGYVDLWKIPVSIMDDIERYEEKANGDLTAHTYTIIQFQKEGKTRYSIDREERIKSPVSEYADKLKDHEQALQEAYEEAWGEDPADEESPVTKPSKRPKKAEAEGVDGWTPNEGQERYGKPPFKERAEESDPVESFTSTEDDEYEGEMIDPSELDQMDADEIKTLFRRSGLRVPRTNDADVLRERLREELAEV